MSTDTRVPPAQVELRHNDDVVHVFGAGTGQQEFEFTVTNENDQGTYTAVFFDQGREVSCFRHLRVFAR